jgi:hypothetical protein
MKNLTMKFFLVLILTGTALSFSNAQPYKINIYNSYVFNDDIDAVSSGNNYFNGTIEGGYQWGIGFEYIIKQTYGLELLYNRQSTNFDVNYTTNTDTNKSKNFGIDVNYILLGGNKYLPIPNNKTVKPFGGILIGMAILNNNDPLPGAETSSTKFAWEGRIGSDFMFSPNVGLRIQGTVQSAVQSIDGGLYLGTGGLGAGLNSESSMYQFGLGGSLIIQFGQPKPKMRIK